MKKRTLNQNWTLCLRKWRWIVKEKIAHKRRWVSTLKVQWLHDNRFKDLSGDCFFCDYGEAENSCRSCPGRLVDSSFSCQREAYHYIYNPFAFLAELLRLNRIRKAKK